MNALKLSEKTSKELEEFSNELKYIKNTEPKIHYIGIYEVLDELVRRIKELKLYDIKTADNYCDTFIKVYRELGDDKDERNQT